MAGLGTPDLHLVESIDDAVEFKVWLGRRRDVLAIDTETQGLSFVRHKLRLVQFGDLDAGWAVPWERWGGVAEEALKVYEGPTVYHNARFDVHFIERALGRKINRNDIHDTRVMAHLIDPVSPTGLKPLAARLVDQRAATASYVLDEAMSKQKWTWATVPLNFEPYWAYGALDTVLTAHLFDQLKPVVDARYSQVYELEMAAGWVVSAMEERGCRIDPVFTERKLLEFEEFVEHCKKWGQASYGVNLGSNQQVVKVLMNEGVEFSKLTASGNNYSLDAEVLESIEHPLAQTVLQMRRTQKLASTYLENFLALHQDAILHPSINMLGARTGRMSITEPALQTLPRADAKNPQAITVRDCFIPSEDNALITCDFAQIEQRVLAHLTQDAGMIAAFNSGDDFFTAMAQQIYGDPTLTKKDPRRQMTKNASYAKAYGAGPAKFALTAGVPEAAGREFLDAYDTRFPGVRAFQQYVEQIARERAAAEGTAYVRTPIGRYQPSDDNRYYTLVNYLIQATSADVLKQAIVELDLAGLGDMMILPVHDEVVFDVPTDDVVDVAQVAQRAMEQREGWAVPLLAEVDGPLQRWGEKFR